MTKLPKVRSGSIATNKGCPRHVCFALDSDRTADIKNRQLRANSGLAQPGRRWNPEWVIVRLYWVRSLMMGVAVCSACS